MLHHVLRCVLSGSRMAFLLTANPPPPAVESFVRTSRVLSHEAVSVGRGGESKAHFSSARLNIRSIRLPKLCVATPWGVACRCDRSSEPQSTSILGQEIKRFGCNEPGLETWLENTDPNFLRQLLEIQEADLL
ncbi:hypothetical protein EVAR_25033_1 [Eumeta japonica]|uniref:Uncharacterized protein n=1 Tax=Eumeta variegata TaxID=151549 RepID=A0A4C1V7B4_EUMVA|nr:hypothetical protein EVAR_25033_1 [Eumeta japonica]